MFYHKIIKYIPLQQGLRLYSAMASEPLRIIKYIPLQQGLRPWGCGRSTTSPKIIKYIPLQQGLRLLSYSLSKRERLLSIFHYNKD